MFKTVRLLLQGFDILERIDHYTSEFFEVAVHNTIFS